MADANKHIPGRESGESASQFVVIRDTREQKRHGWVFDKRIRDCQGTVDQKLDTGDYSLRGLEDRFVIERKGAVSEYATNIFEARFVRELDRLRSFAMAYIVLEFPFSDMVDYPRVPSIPKFLRSKIRVSGPLFLKKHLEFEHSYPTIRWHFAAHNGKQLATSLCRRAVEFFGDTK